MKIAFEFKEGSNQEVVTDCPYKRKSRNEAGIDWFIKVGSLSCGLCKHNNGIDIEAQTVECFKGN